MAVDKPSALNQLSASDMPSNEPTLPAGFAYNAQNWAGKRRSFAVWGAR
ncbi:MAG: hypothetical protein VYA33_04405 [Pseudomonadota bacterium]|nr:hypothetical protein [Pseudomonadota bacterium]